MIDPVLVYSTYLGGSGDDESFRIAVDASGNAYVAGFTPSTSYPTTAGAFQPSYGGGNYDAFVSKLNPSGTALVYSTYLGGNDFDSGYGIAADGSGNAYVTGFTASTNFPTTVGAFQTSYGGGINDAYVTKLNPSGTALVYSTYLGSSDADGGYRIVVDGSGNTYVAGITTDFSPGATDFPTTAGAAQTSYGGGGYDTFVTKLNPTGTGLVYSTYLGGSSDETVNVLTVDGVGNAYVTGATISTNFPTTAGAFQTGYGGGNRDAFVSKLNPSGTALVYSTYLGGNDFDAGFGIAVDGAGNAYVTGSTVSTNFPTTAGALQTSYGGGGNDAYVTKLNPSGTALVYSTYFGSSGSDGGSSIAVDGLGNAYFVGSTSSTNIPTTPDAFQTSSGGGSDAMLVKLNSAGTALVYSTYFGGTGADSGAGIVLDGSGSAYITGLTASSNFPTTPGACKLATGADRTTCTWRSSTSGPRSSRRRCRTGRSTGPTARPSPPPAASGR